MVLFKFATAYGRVAQLDRAPDYGSGGWGFDSSLVHTEYQAVMSSRCSCFFHLTNIFTINSDGTGLALIYNFDRNGTGPSVDINANGEKVIWCCGYGTRNTGS